MLLLGTGKVLVSLAEPAGGYSTESGQQQLAKGQAARNHRHLVADAKLN